LGLPRATRFETTTKFTGRPLLFHSTPFNCRSSIWFLIILCTN
jgi:hypothetical protein